MNSNGHRAGPSYSVKKPSPATFSGPQGVYPIDPEDTNQRGDSSGYSFLGQDAPALHARRAQNKALHPNVKRAAMLARLSDHVSGNAPRFTAQASTATMAGPDENAAISSRAQTGAGGNDPWHPQGPEQARMANGQGGSNPTYPQGPEQARTLNGRGGSSPAVTVHGPERSRVVNARGSSSPAVTVHGKEQDREATVHRIMPTRRAHVFKGR